MLETPLFGRFIGENKYLVFAPAQEYLWLVGGCIIGGLGMAGLALWQASAYFLWLGLAVFGAGIWGGLSLQWILFNLREKVYTRRQGPGIFPRTTRGKFSDLEAVFLLAEERLLLGRQATYRLVLQWRGMREPSMILQQDYAGLPPGAPLNHGAGRLFHFGAQAARALGLPIVDHTHVSTPNPLPITR